MLKNLLGVKNFIIKRLVNKYLGIICFIRANFIFTSGVLFIIINIKSRLFL